GCADTGGRAAHPANLCERRDAAEERCLHRGNQYASHHDLHCSARRSGRLVNNNIDAASVANVRPTRAVRRAAPSVTISAISVARPITAIESASETAAHAGSTKVAAHVSAAAEPAAHMSATTETAPVSTPTSPATRERVSGQSPSE